MTAWSWSCLARSRAALAEAMPASACARRLAGRDVSARVTCSSGYAADVEDGAAVVGVGLGGGGRGAREINLVLRHSPAGGELVVARAFGGGAGALGVGGGDRGLRGAHPGVGKFLLGVEADERSASGGGLCFGGLQIGRGRGDAGIELLRVDAYEGVTGVDRLVIAHQHRGDPGRAPWKPRWRWSRRGDRRRRWRRRAWRPEIEERPP